MKKQCLALLLGILSILPVAFAQTNPLKCPAAAGNNTISYEGIESCLQADGVLLEVHGAVPMSSMFVVTFRHPTNFFLSVHLSLIGGNVEMRNFIKTLKRHDVILVKGKFEQVESPQKHVRAQTISLVSRSQDSTHSSEYQYQALPAEILQMSELTGRVHSVFGEGRILVVEYKDLVVPVYVQDPWLAQTRALYRGDKIHMKYVIQEEPVRPVHLNFDPNAPQALTVLRSVVQGHGEPVTMTGKLLRFPQSPQIIFPIFAINVDIGDGVMLDHTILSFTDMELFTKIREMFQAAWDKYPLMVRNYRNKEINDALTVTVSGTYNMIDPGQANPQVVMERLEDITIVEE